MERDNITELRVVLLDLLREFDRVCRKHGIKYSIDGGTLLGKARHNGFIPWDDDIDLIILRSEYEKLRKIAPSEFQHPYFFQNAETDPTAMRGHPQLRNSDTTMILKDESFEGKAIYKTFNQGAFIDIFVLDEVPDDPSERVKYFRMLSHLKTRMQQIKIWTSERLSLANFKRFLAGLKNKLYLFWIRCTTGQDPVVYIQSQFDMLCRRYQGNNTEGVCYIQFEPWPPENHIVLRKNVMDVEDAEFAGTKIMMLKNWEYYLDRVIGNWHKYVVGGSDHGDVLVDLSRPYTEWM